MKPSVAKTLFFTIIQANSSLPEGWEINYVLSHKKRDFNNNHVVIGTTGDQVVIARIKETVRPSFRRSLISTICVLAGGIFFFIGLAIIQKVKFTKKCTIGFSKTAKMDQQITDCFKRCLLFLKKASKTKKQPQQ